jgi:hypothetical protein
LDLTTSESKRSKQILDEVRKFDLGLTKIKEMERRAENPVVKRRKIPQNLMQLQPIVARSPKKLKGSQTARSRLENVNTKANFT